MDYWDCWWICYRLKKNLQDSKNICHCEDTKQSHAIQGEDAQFAIATLRSQ